MEVTMINPDKRRNKRLSVRLTYAARWALEDYAAERGLKISDVVRDIVVAWGQEQGMIDAKGKLSRLYADKQESCKGE